MRLRNLPRRTLCLGYELKPWDPRYADNDAKFDISTLEVIDGGLPPRAARLPDVSAADVALDPSPLLNRLPLDDGILPSAKFRCSIHVGQGYSDICSTIERRLIEGLSMAISKSPVLAN